MNSETCRFQFEEDDSCTEPRAQNSSFCLLHDPNLDKTNPEIRKKILKAIESGQSLNGAHLEGMDLSHVDLSGRWLIRANLKNANLERANCEHAHLYGADLRGANLFNANFHQANLKETNMEGAHLLEAKLEEAKVLGILWGRNNKIVNEKEGERLEKRKDFSQAKETYREAEEIYRNIRTRLMTAGIPREAGEFFYREMVVKRKQSPLFSFKRMSSKIVDILCGYGEKAYRVLTSAVLLIFICSVLYFIFGVHHEGTILVINPENGLWENLHHYALTVYYSIVTFTTLGYGDIAPFGPSRVVASLEAFLGSFMIALFVVVFVRKALR